ncbi:3'-5' exonuclease [Cellulosilyticum ruminicola]|uniref:3'-5' exonuclease n=1 Tax=Cellulosilyticum ruminicola TaxID=425254 RepID=UPI0006D25ECF|nr:3'-5' exonuclease [Cellulosilyticum ruminicola]
MKTSKVAILVRTRELVRKIQRFMHDINDYQVLRGEMGYWNENINLSIGTYHAAKGLEFDTVIMPFCNTEVIPDESNLRAFDDRDDALAEEIKLIYVTVTRARRGLILTYSGTRSELIPENKNGIYQEFEV